MPFPTSLRRVYIDSSVWIAVLTNEPSSETLTQWLATENGQLMTSFWTQTELASALGIKARRKELTQEQVTHILQEFFVWVQDDVEMLPANEADFALATHLCARIESGIRAGDALHLAIAHHHGATHIASLDLNMNRNAVPLGLQLFDRYSKIL